MNDELQSQLSQILNQITTSVGEVKDFSVAQLPDIAQQYIRYGLWSSAFGAIASGVAALVMLALCLHFYRGGSNTDFRYRDDWFMGVAFFGSFSIIPLMFVIGEVRNLILITTAPKVWFILEIKNLIS